MSKVNVKCPRCDYSTGEVEGCIAAALLSAHATLHGPGQSSNSGGAKPPPVERPKLQAACPKADWKVFTSRWRTFKAAVNILPTKEVHQLLGCLEGDAAKLLYNEHATPETLSEEELLKLLEKVLVKPENVWVTNTGDSSLNEARRW